MAEPTPKPVVQFTLDPHSPSKRPEQLMTLLQSTLQREFPDAAGVVEVSLSPEDGVVSILHLDQLEEDVAATLAHRARVVFNDFMISPWY